MFRRRNSRGWEIDGTIGLSICPFQARLLWLWLMRWKVPCSWVRMFAHVQNLLLVDMCFKMHIFILVMYVYLYIYLLCTMHRMSFTLEISHPFLTWNLQIARFGESSLHHFGCRTAKTRRRPSKASSIFTTWGGSNVRPRNIAPTVWYPFL